VNAENLLKDRQSFAYIKAKYIISKRYWSSYLYIKKKPM